MTRLGNGLRRMTAARRLKTPYGKLARPVLGAGFPRGATTRVLIYHFPNAISWSLVYPYFENAERLADRFGMHVRTLPVQDFLDAKPGPDADLVIVQPWFTDPPERIGRAFAQYRNAHPDARLVFLDSYAHTDLRFGQYVEPYVDLYQRKALFTDRSAFLRPFAGDTNLTDYYSRLYGLPADPVDWAVPHQLLDRLVLAPNFLTDPELMQGFLGAKPDFKDRPIDLHSRIAVKGTPWYSAMRQHAKDAASGLRGVTVTPEGRIPKAAFMAELRRSRLCWSPFGYGELCWRDLEAFVSGAVLVKPDMDHLQTRPELYVAGETYLPVRWDFSDLEDVVRKALGDPEGRRRIASNAFRAARSYLADHVFVDEVGEMLSLVRGQSRLLHR